MSLPCVCLVYCESMFGVLGLPWWLGWQKNLPAMQETGVGKNLWRREWQPAPVFLPGESHGQRILAGHSPWGHKELDMTIWLAHIWVDELQYPNLSSVWEVLSHYFFKFFFSLLPLSPMEIQKLTNWFIWWYLIDYKAFFILFRFFFSSD